MNYSSAVIITTNGDYEFVPECKLYTSNWAKKFKNVINCNSTYGPIKGNDVGVTYNIYYYEHDPHSYEVDCTGISFIDELIFIFHENTYVINPIGYEFVKHLILNSKKGYNNIVIGSIGLIKYVDGFMTNINDDDINWIRNYKNKEIRWAPLESDNDIIDFPSTTDQIQQPTKPIVVQIDESVAVPEHISEPVSEPIPEPIPEPTPELIVEKQEITSVKMVHPQMSESSISIEGSVIYDDYMDKVSKKEAKAKQDQKIEVVSVSKSWSPMSWSWKWNKQD